MNSREQKFYDYCMSVPYERYYEMVAKRCRRITSDHVINTYERIADWVYRMRGESR